MAVMEGIKLESYSSLVRGDVTVAGVALELRTCHPLHCIRLLSTSGEVVFPPLIRCVIISYDR